MTRVTRVTRATCSQLEQVEELALGNLRGEEAAAARIHLMGCVACEEAHSQFVAERTLFLDRDDARDVPPFLDTTALARDVEPQPHSFLRTAQAMVAVAAGVAAIIHAAPRVSPVTTDAVAETSDGELMSSAEPSFSLVSRASKLASACEMPSPDVEGAQCSSPSNQYFSRARDDDQGRLCQDNDTLVCANSSTIRQPMSSTLSR